MPRSLSSATSKSRLGDHMALIIGHRFSRKSFLPCNAEGRANITNWGQRRLAMMTWNKLPFGRPLAPHSHIYEAEGTRILEASSNQHPSWEAWCNHVQWISSRRGHDTGNCKMLRNFIKIIIAKAEDYLKCLKHPNRVARSSALNQGQPSKGLCIFVWSHNPKCKSKEASHILVVQ